ncbi:hypothetical protein [Novosphingobium terrae]|uniref:hypothetical protein n=1 Tax=Novosphingobium terrae TaxID=2726189 RepID=UPI00197E47DD|nr:hypothetical protein [Novosphingobium terrae]
MTFLLPLLWITGWIAASAWYRRSRGKPIIPRVPGDAVFHENWCSGRSMRNWLTRIGGARNCLMVYVQGQDLVVTAKFPFNLTFLPEIYGPDVRVPLVTIVSVRPLTRLFQKVLRLEFATGGPAPIELILHDEAGFVRHLGQSIAVHADRRLQARQNPKKRFNLTYFRLFFAVWGAGALFAAWSGLPDDWRFRHDGAKVAAVFQAPDLAVDPRGHGILAYRVHGHDYRLTSFNGAGTYTVGATESIYYLPGDPQNARQEGLLVFDLGGLGLGVLALSFSLFGAALLRRLS